MMRHDVPALALGAINAARNEKGASCDAPFRRLWEKESSY